MPTVLSAKQESVHEKYRARINLKSIVKFFHYKEHMTERSVRPCGKYLRSITYGVGGKVLSDTQSFYDQSIAYVSWRLGKWVVISVWTLTWGKGVGFFHDCSIFTWMGWWERPRKRVKMIDRDQKNGFLVNNFLHEDMALVVRSAEQFQCFVTVQKEGIREWRWKK